MKPGDLVKVSWLSRYGSQYGMILEYDNNDPVDLIPAKVVVQGKITYVGKEFIKPLKNNAHAS